LKFVLPHEEEEEEEKGLVADPPPMRYALGSIGHPVDLYQL